jgi:glycosyltransferase involved in cell wall biosynthesis
VEHLVVQTEDDSPNQPDRPYKFFYPAYPRTFKNIEQILNAVRMLEHGGFDQFEVWLTMDGTENRYAADLRKQFSRLTTVKWLGLLPRSEVLCLYARADCLVFPSKLETWGMPITEFKATGKPILAAELPYAHETVGEYKQAAFFNIESDPELAAMMKQAALGEPIFRPAKEQPIASPFSRNWEELWKILLTPADLRSSPKAQRTR